MMANREPGYYWVRYSHRWIIAEWDSRHWWRTGWDVEMEDEDFDAIGPRVTDYKPTPPEEPSDG